MHLLQRQKHRGHWGNFKPNFRTELIKACTICGILLICMTVMEGGNGEGKREGEDCCNRIENSSLSSQISSQVVLAPGRIPGAFPRTERSDGLSEDLTVPKR